MLTSALSRQLCTLRLRFPVLERYTLCLLQIARGLFSLRRPGCSLKEDGRVQTGPQMKWGQIGNALQDLASGVPGAACNYLTSLPLDSVEDGNG